MAIRRMDGGRERFLQFVSLAAEDGDEDCKKFLVVYTELNATQRTRADIDLMCSAAGVSRVSLLKTVVGVAFEHGAELANLIAAAAHPAIVDRTIESAKRLESDIGAKDRQHLLAHAGFLPTPKGTIVNVTASALAASAAAPALPEARMPTFLADVSAAHGARDAVQRQLTAGDVVDGEVVSAIPAIPSHLDELVEWPR
jgi:hypothetical protein